MTAPQATMLVRCPRDRHEFAAPIRPIIQCPTCGRHYNFNIPTQKWTSDRDLEILDHHAAYAAMHRLSLGAFLGHFPEEHNQEIKNFLQSFSDNFIYVKDLLQKFTADDIRSLTWNVPAPWGYSAPSWSQMSNPNFWDENFNNIVRMENGNLAFYFYKEARK